MVRQKKEAIQGAQAVKTFHETAGTVKWKHILAFIGANRRHDDRAKK